MKSLICLILSIAILSTSTSAFAVPKIRVSESARPISQVQLGGQLVSVEEFRLVVDEVTYSLQNFEKVIGSLENDKAKAALAGISRNVAIDLKETFEAGLSLLAVLVNNESLDFDDRLEKAAALHGALASLTFRILRDRYADNKHVDELKQNKTLIDYLSDLTVGTLREIRYDAASLLPTKSIENETLIGAVERGRREELGKEIIFLYQKFAAEHLPIPQGEHQAAAIRMDFLDYAQKMMLQIKESRWHSQIGATGVYAAMSYLAIFHPLVDAFGIVEGGRSENSLIASSAIYFTFWAFVTATKGLTITSKSVGMLKDLRQLLEDPKASVSKANLYDRFKTRLWRLDGEKTPVKDDSKSFMARACAAFGKR